MNTKQFFNIGIIFLNPSKERKERRQKNYAGTHLSSHILKSSSEVMADLAPLHLNVGPSDVPLPQCGDAVLRPFQRSPDV